MEAMALRKPKTAGNENTAMLKIIAIACMMIDHAGAIFYPSMIELRIIGRIAFPLYAWCAVVGICHTRRPWRYAMWLLCLGVISQPFYVEALSHDWRSLNILATLLLGVLALWGVREKKWGSQFWAPVLSLLLSCIFKIDYGWKGVALILLLYMVRNSKSGLTALMIAFCLFWGQGSITFGRIFGMQIYSYSAAFPQATTLISALTRVQFWGILSLPMILIPMKTQVHLPKWLSYSAYPAHLFLYCLIKLI